MLGNFKNHFVASERHDGRGKRRIRSHYPGELERTSAIDFKDAATLDLVIAM